MATHGEIINLYLMGGDKSGVWQATMLSWTGCGYKIPHNKLKDCADLDNINTPGVYFLFGKDDAADKPFIYVGEAEEVHKRLLQPHVFEKEGLYWTEAIAFVTTDGTLEKGRVKYLENRFFQIARDANRYELKNGKTPTQSKVSAHIRDFLEQFIEAVELIIPTLGYMPFIPLPSEEAKDQDELYLSKFKGKGGDAKGKRAADGFWVLKGSYIYPDVADYVSSGIKNARAKYADVIDENGILQQDICFGSPSVAGTFVRGRNVNGLKEWKTKDGISLKDLDTGATPVKRKKTADPSPKVSTPERLLYLKSKKATATAKMTDAKFIILKGSDFCETVMNSCKAYTKSKRSQLIAKGQVKNGKFIEDVTFTSPSSAAACILGASVNGYKLWFYEDGSPIKSE